VIKVIYQVLCGLSVAHSNGIIHGRLSARYVFLSQDKDIATANIAISNFGVTQLYRTMDLVEKPGSEYFIAPEMLTNVLTEGSDIWAVGIIAFMLVEARPPFTGSSKTEVLTNVAYGKVEFNENCWAEYPNLRPVVVNMLNADHTLRPSAQILLEEEIFSNEFRNRKTGPSRGFTALRKLQDFKQ
jgi:serine/threonine protein kinase